MVLNLLDDYSREIENPEFKIKDTVIAQIDEYLGELGQTKHYPYKEDIQWIPLWIDVNEPSDTRYVYTFDEDGVAESYVTADGLQVATYNI